MTLNYRNSCRWFWQLEPHYCLSLFDMFRFGLACLTCLDLVWLVWRAHASLKFRFLATLFGFAESLGRPLGLGRRLSTNLFRVPSPCCLTLIYRCFFLNLIFVLLQMSTFFLLNGRTMFMIGTICFLHMIYRIFPLPNVSVFFPTAGSTFEYLGKKSHTKNL